MRGVVKVVGKDELVAMSAAVGPAPHAHVDRASLAQRYNVTTHQPVGCTLTEKLPPDAPGSGAPQSRRFPVAVLPLAITHRQVYYELGVSAMVSELTSGTSGSSCVVVDGGHATRRWMLEGSSAAPGLMYAAMDQLALDWQSLALDYAHVWTIRVGAVAVHRDTITDLLGDAGAPEEARDAWRTAMGGKVHSNAPGSPPKHTRRTLTLEECRRTRSVVVDGAQTADVNTPSQARDMLAVLMRRAGSVPGAAGGEAHLVFTVCVERADCADGGGDLRVQRLHFVALGSEAPSTSRGGGPHPTGFRSAAQACLAAIKDQHASVPFHRNKLTWFLRPYLQGGGGLGNAALLTCLTPFAPITAGAGLFGDSFRDAAVYAGLAAQVKQAASTERLAEVVQRRVPPGILSRKGNSSRVEGEGVGQGDAPNSPGRAGHDRACESERGGGGRRVQVVDASHSPPSHTGRGRQHVHGGYESPSRACGGDAGALPHPHAARRPVTHHLVAVGHDDTGAGARVGVLQGDTLETIDRNTTAHLNISGISTLSANTATTAVTGTPAARMHVLSDSPGALPPRAALVDAPRDDQPTSPATVPRSTAPPPSVQISAASSNVFSYADITKALAHAPPARAADQLPAADDARDASSTERCSGSGDVPEAPAARPRGESAASVRADFDMYRQVMDATLLRLRQDVVRVTAEKEAVQRAVQRREKVWQRERNELFTVSQDLKLATRRVEELEAQRAELQGEFHEELTKLDRRQHVLVEEKLRVEREAAERIAALEAEVEALRQQSMDTRRSPSRPDSQIPMLLEANTALHRDISDLRIQLDEKNAQLLDALQARAVPDGIIDEDDAASSAGAGTQTDHGDARETAYAYPQPTGSLQLPTSLGSSGPQPLPNIPDLVTGVHPAVHKHSSGKQSVLPAAGAVARPRSAKQLLAAPSFGASHMLPKPPSPGLAAVQAVRQASVSPKSRQLSAPPVPGPGSPRREARPGGLVPGATPGSFHVRGDLLRDRLSQLAEHPPRSPGHSPQFCSPEPRPEKEPPAPVKRS